MRKKKKTFFLYFETRIFIPFINWLYYEKKNITHSYDKIKTFFILGLVIWGFDYSVTRKHGKTVDNERMNTKLSLKYQLRCVWVIFLSPQIIFDSLIVFSFVSFKLYYKCNPYSDLNCRLLPPELAGNPVYVDLKGDFYYNFFVIVKNEIWF